jgi:hypothetical protein
MEKKIPDKTQKNAGNLLPYSPSFIDKFLRFIQRLPIPYWMTYLLLFILESILNHVLAWIDGWLPAFNFNTLLLLFPLWQWGTLASITYLNHTSETTLSNFRPLLDKDNDAVDKLKYEFTTMPIPGVILNGLLWIVGYLLLTYLSYDAFYVRYGLGNFFKVFNILEGLICFAIGSVIYYHSIRQLRLVNRTVKLVKRFNLFNLQPVYAFSRLTSRTGISWMFLLVLTLLMFPLDLAKGLALVVLVLQVVMALAAFVLPLRLVNYHLASEKRRLLAENRRRIEAALAKLHERLDQNELSEMGLLNQAIIGLNSEREILSKISIWPWRTDTLTGFLSAIGLPIILLLIQIAIKKWFGG